MLKIVIAMSLLAVCPFVFQDVKDWIKTKELSMYIKTLVKSKKTLLAMDKDLLIMTCERNKTVIIATIDEQQCVLLVDKPLTAKNLDCSEYRETLVKKAMSLYRQGKFIDMEVQGA